mgnify:FL=1
MVGLSEKEVADLRKAWGYNELPLSEKTGFWGIIRLVSKEPMFLLLIGCGSLYMVLGDYIEGLVLSLAVFLIIGITFFQHKKTSRALALLKQLSSPRALVLRQEGEKMIPARELVPGDFIILQEGARVPADAELLECGVLMTDESMLTGESFPVKKDTTKNYHVFLGSLVVGGRGIARVVNTGVHTQFGKIGLSLSSIETVESPLQKEMRGVIRVFFLASVVISVLVVILFYVKSNKLIESILIGLSSSMAILPEEFPVVLSVFMAIGAWRLTKNNVLTRMPGAIESLGAASVLCTDKTGTITQNKMQIAVVYNGNGLLFKKNFNARSVSFDQIIQTAVGASSLSSADPMERAILDTQREWGVVGPHPDSLIKEYPLTDQLLAMSRVLRGENKNEHRVAAKGAPEAIFRLCGLDEKEKNKHQRVVNDLARAGFRMIGVSEARIDTGSLPEKQDLFSFRFLGLIGFEDPIRPEVPAAIEECNTAGIRVVVITGDHPETARSIAKQIGLKNAGHVLTGDQLEVLDKEELKKQIGLVSVFARVRPQQKLLLVELFQKTGAVVAMTGDGVNDAPALQRADIGVAMGQRGTDVARESADLVLLDDNFASIVAAIRSGRRIYDNLQKAMSYIVAIHIPIIGLVIMPALFTGVPILLFPVHIVFMELIIDPVCSIAFESEAEEEGIMNRTPRNTATGFFAWRNFWGSLLGGLGALMFVVIVYIYETRAFGSIGEARALAFCSLILANLLLVFSSLSKTRRVLRVVVERNRAALFISGVAVVVLALSILVNPIADLFRFEQPGLLRYWVVVFGGVLFLFYLEGIKKIKSGA